MLLTRPPLTSGEQAPRLFARLACIRHAASVHPEPGSNSPLLRKFCSFALLPLLSSSGSRAARMLLFALLVSYVDVYISSLKLSPKLYLSRSQTK